MADYGAAISLSRELSHTSDNSSTEQSPRLFPALSTPNHPPSSSKLLIRRNQPATSPDDHHQIQSKVQTQRKPRGRPPGSKNKPKPPIIITNDSNSAMKPAVLEISAGSDIIDTIISFARKNHAGISVISATGSVSNVTLRHPVSHAPCLSLHGPFNLLALFGSFVGATKPSSSSGSGGGYSFGISLAGSQGQVFGGIVTGKVIAASQVVVVAATFLNPTFHRLPSENGHEDDEAEETKPSVGGGNGSESCVSTGMSMGVYGVGSSNPAPINCQMSPPEVMHWGPSRPPY